MKGRQDFRPLCLRMAKMVTRFYSNHQTDPLVQLSLALRGLQAAPRQALGRCRAPAHLSLSSCS